jgi:hypothetical protein
MKSDEPAAGDLQQPFAADGGISAPLLANVIHTKRWMT